MVEYDDDDEPKKRPLLVIGIALAVILLGAGLGWMLVGNFDDPEGDLAKVPRALKAQQTDDVEEPEEEEEEEEDDPIVIAPTKKKKVKKNPLTFEQVLSGMKSKIKRRCSSLGEGPVDIDSYVVLDGGPAIAPKIKPSGPVGNCARRIVEGTRFPASDTDHDIKERVNW